MSAARSTVQVDGSEILIRIQSTQPSPPDRLICLDPPSCKAEGLELKGLQRKVDAGELATVKIGRKHYVRLSDLLKLPKALARAEREKDEASYASVVAKAASKASAKARKAK